VRENPHDRIYLVGVEDGLQFLTELLSVCVKGRRWRWLGPEVEFLLIPVRGA
jgi:hypothetical protein